MSSANSPCSLAPVHHRSSASGCPHHLRGCPGTYLPLQSHKMPSRKLENGSAWSQALSADATENLIWEEKLQINIPTFVCPRLPRSQSGSFSIYNRHVNYDFLKEFFQLSLQKLTIRRERKPNTSWGTN